MLDFELTPRHAGLCLWGDYAALERLHAFIHHVVEVSPIVENKEGFVLGLAYDVRKAFEGQRRKAWRGRFDEERCRTFGVEILWPVLLLQAGLLRQSMSFIPTDRLDQSVMYELEHVIVSALRKATPAAADDVIYAAQRACGNPYAHLELTLTSRCIYFIELTPNRRLSALPKLMETFDLAYESSVDPSARSRRGSIPPTAFTGPERDWPDFEW